MLTDKDIFDALRERRGIPPTAGTYDRATLEAELTRDEGERLKAYKDTKGKWTIGIGHNLDDCGTAPLARGLLDVLANGINAAEADQFFAHDIARTENDLDTHLSWWRSLDPVRQRVLLNMCFNMGIGNAQHGLCSFVNTLGMIQRGEYSQAAAAMEKSEWADEVGIRAQRLADMMKDGRI